MADEEVGRRQGEGDGGSPRQFYIAGASPLPPAPQSVSADLVWESGGERIAYRATAGHIDVRSDGGSLMGRMFHLSYVAAGAGDALARPVTFCYNGGPGSASVPINVGGIGPRRVATAGISHLAQPAVMEDNPATLLRASDLVFLDALGTGYSELAEGFDPTQVWGVEGDADSFARAIEAWLTENGRWGSPVYLFGESYGTVRNAVLMRLLAERFIPVTGAVMMSSVFDWVTKMPGSDLSYLGLLPTYAATARYFGRAGRGSDEEAWFDDAMAFAERAYAPALLAGDRLPAAERASMARRLSDLIGLPPELIERCRLRVDLDTFRRSLLADEGRVLGRFDTRFTSYAPLALQGTDVPFAGSDASSDAVEPAWNAAFRRHLAEIGYRGAPRYPLSSFATIGVGWDRSHIVPGAGGMRADAPNVAYDLAEALRRNPTARVAVLGGRYDAATPFWNAVHDVSRLFLPDALRERVTFRLYSCGHMAYVDEPTLELLGRDLAAFYGRAEAAGRPAATARG